MAHARWLNDFFNYTTTTINLKIQNIFECCFEDLLLQLLLLYYYFYFEALPKIII